MNRLLLKKINLLLHLAKVDGKFDHSEKQLLVNVLKESGLDGSFLESHEAETVKLDTLAEIPDKSELFYWVMKMIKADNILHADEIAYAKTVALKLNLKPEVVDYYSQNEVPDLPSFTQTIKQFVLS